MYILTCLPCGLCFRSRNRSGHCSDSNVTGDSHSLQHPVHATEETLKQVCARMVKVKNAKNYYKGDNGLEYFVLVY